MFRYFVVSRPIKGAGSDVFELDEETGYIKEKVFNLLTQKTKTISAAQFVLPNPPAPLPVSSKESKSVSSKCA
jgi:hypothetical protein